jgi:prepilin signal peptidase PulO-like enzyme (type II secretory pathway)
VTDPLVLVGIGLLGLIVGSLVNAGIYALAWSPRPISPWQRPHPEAPPRHWFDWAPVVGWLALARESKLHGRGFWIRPLLIELVCAIGLPALYWWVISGKLTPLLPIPGFVGPTSSMLHHMFISQAILMALMMVATFIDFDEKTIPDEITIPGTLLALALAAVWPDSHLPVVRLLTPPPLAGYAPLLLTSTSDWPTWLNSWRGAALGAALFVGWCVALIPALCTLRRGWWNAVRYYFASLARESAWWKLLLLAVAGSPVIVAVWWGAGPQWEGLLTSLVGLAFGGGLVWAVRIVSGVALGKEAMGFGDVTLMAMIGAFLGWQPCLIIFSMSPFAALFVALAQWALTGRRDLAFGPYLCLAAVMVIVWWPSFWKNLGPFFATGWLLLIGLAACLFLMMAMLMAWRMIERSFFS